MVNEDEFFIEDEFVSEEEQTKEGPAETVPVRNKHGIIPEDRGKYKIIPVKQMGIIQKETVNKILKNPKLLYCIAEMEFRTVGDYFLKLALKDRFPNAREIKNEFDRAVNEELLLQSDKDCIEIGTIVLLGFLESHYDVNYVFYNDELVGHFRTMQYVHAPINCNCDINLRGSEIQKARTANVIIRFWEKHYAKMLYDNGFTNACSMTLTNKHAAVVKKMTRREKQLYNDKQAGWKFSGSTLSQFMNGKETKEYWWTYNLKRKFEELKHG